jgi:hypothetical protein
MQDNVVTGTLDSEDGMKLFAKKGTDREYQK